MQRLAVEQRRVLGPRAPWHVGDIAWGLWQHEGREHEWEFRHWDDQAWAWLRLDTGLLDYDVHPDHPELIDAILDEPRARTAHAFEDDEERRAILARHGYTTPGEALHFYVRELAERPAIPVLPEGFRERTVDDADLAERVAIHRDVWAPSRVTESSYANVREAWPYRASLDCVIEAPDGRFAAYALLWPDDANHVGELEPVGVRSEFRRQRLGAAVCTAALAHWYDEGGRQAIVYCLSDSACALYESVGFRRHATLVAYER
jgi:ribosomal protein S18 acetylase RimI-like enzyme